MEEGTVQRLLGRLRALRVERGLTQEEFAEQSGISYKYYQAVEAGRKLDLRLSTLDRLARAHGMETWQLLAPAGHLESAAGKVKPKASRVKRTKG